MAHRGQWSEHEARGVLSAWRKSGQTLERFAKERGLVPQRIRWWWSKLEGKSAALVPVQVTEPAPAKRGEPVAVCLRSGHIVKVGRGFDEGRAARRRRRAEQSAREGQVRARAAQEGAHRPQERALQDAAHPGQAGHRRGATGEASYAGGRPRANSNCAHRTQSPGRGAHLPELRQRQAQAHRRGAGRPPSTNSRRRAWSVTSTSRRCSAAAAAITSSPRRAPRRSSRRVATERACSLTWRSQSVRTTCRCSGSRRTSRGAASRSPARR